jgi:uncharacterized protein (DUF2237 family)
MTYCRRLAALPEGKRGIAIVLTTRYLQILASRLEDPSMPRPQATHTNGGLTPEPEPAAERMSCSYCAQEFTRTQPGQRFCSTTCRKAMKEDRRTCMLSRVDDGGYVAALAASGGSFR